MGSNESSSIIRRALNSYDGLSADEKNRFNGWLLQIVAAYQPIQEMHQRGLVDGGAYSAAEATVIGYLKCPGCAELWREIKWTYPPALVTHLDQAVESSEVAPFTESLSFLGPDNANG
jgi:hypothetical protein